jgi:hypothetical protein
MIFLFYLAVIVLGITILTNWRKEVTIIADKEKDNEVKVISETYYESYCWNCGKSQIIDSRIDKICSKCNKYYKCSKCNKCLCDKKESIIRLKRNNIEDKKWILTSTKTLNSYGHCSSCGSKLSGDKSKKLCYKCWKKKENSILLKGHCQTCGKKLKGNVNKPQCYSCFKGKSILN